MGRPAINEIATRTKRMPTERIVNALMDGNVLALRRVDVLSALSDEALERVSRSCHVQRFAPKKEVLSADEKSTDVYFILTGTLRVSLYAANGRAVVLRTLAAGDMFGELAALDGSPRSATIEAIESCELASMHARDFMTLLRGEPDFSMALIKRLASQVRGLSDRIFEFSTLPVPSRIHAELFRLAMQAKKTGGEVLIFPAPTLKDLAACVSTHREAVSRELNRLKRMGILKRERKGLRILDMNRLQSLVNLARDDGNGTS